MANLKYSDLDLSFTKNPVNKDLLKLSNKSAIENSIKNLLLTYYYEMPFHPELGSGIRNQLFDNWLPTSASIIEKNINFIIRNYEPRVILLGIQIINNKNNPNSIRIQVFYSIKATSENGVVNVILDRVR